MTAAMVFLAVAGLCGIFVFVGVGVWRGVMGALTEADCNLAVAQHLLDAAAEHDAKWADMPRVEGKPIPSPADHPDNDGELAAGGVS